MSRLNRESNPTPGEKPGFMPQHEAADGTMRNTGENNPLPVNGNVQLTGRNVEQVIFVDGLSVTTSGTATTPSEYISKYKDVQYYVKNTTDQPVDVFIQHNNLNVIYYNGTDFVNSGQQKITIPAGTSSPMFINDYYPTLLNKLTAEPVRFGYTFTTAPTSGTLTIKAQAVIN